MAKIQVDINNKAIMLNNKALLAQEFIGIPRVVSNGTIQLNQANHTYTVPDNVTDIGGYAYYSGFYSDKKLTRFNSNKKTLKQIDYS